MVHDDTKLAIVLGWTATQLPSITDFKDGCCLNEILEPIVADDRHIDPIAARQEQQLIQIADKLQSIPGIIGVFWPAYPAVEAGDGLANGVVDEEIAGDPRNGSVDRENKPGWLSRF